MPYVNDCSEWRVIQALGLGIAQRKSRFDRAIASCESSSFSLANPVAELLEVELRRVFLHKDCLRNLSLLEFEECEAGLKSLCGLLNHLVHPRLCQTVDGLEYPQLRALTNHLETSQETFDLACGRHSTLFKLPKDQDDLKRVLVAVSEYNDLVTRLFATPSTAASLRPVTQKERTWKDARIRDRAAAVLGSLFGHFRCGTKHEVMLKLLDHAEGGTASPNLDVMLPLCPDSSRWHEVKCCAAHSSENTSITAVHNICTDLKQYAGRGRDLMLLIGEDELFQAWDPFPQNEKLSASPKESLDELIATGVFKPLDLRDLASRSSLVRYNTQEKRTLAVRLGHCLMDFFDADLSSKRIYLRGPSTMSFRKKPLYLSFASCLPGTDEPYVFRAGHPALLSFSKLLLEIGFGQCLPLKISSQYNEDSLDTWAGLCDIVDQVEEYEDDSYLQAIRGCLMVHRQISKALRSDSADPVNARLTIREELYREVVRKLEIGLAESTPRAPHKRQRSESPEPSSKRMCGSNKGRDENVCSANSYYTRRNTPSWQLELGSPFGAPDSPVPARHDKPTRGEIRSTMETHRRLHFPVQIPGSSGFFDESTTARYPPNLCKYADDFMETLRCVYDGAIQDLGNTPRVKVAVLDTGLDLSHPAVEANRERIKDLKSWLPPGTVQYGSDVSGHGTHVTGLLLDVAPDCDVYVAQIAEHQPTSAAQVAKAVNYAITDWKVDIITMSFGFPDESLSGCSDLRHAILEAHALGVLMFAAASNTGAHGAAPAFPARLSNVFCVYSGDGMGNCASTNPTARVREYNFLTLGEAVESAWPCALAQIPWKKRKSGTSFATPIAAGIAAFLLLYAYQNLPREEARRFKEYDKMRDWLFHLSNERGGYNVISVGNFFRLSVEERRMHLTSFLNGKSWKT